MAVTFAVRGDSFDARYSTEGKTPGIAGASHSLAETVADATSINGVTSLDFTRNTTVAQRPVTWPGRSNTPSDRPRSMLWRFKPDSFTNTIALGFMGCSHKNWYNYLGLSYNSSKQYIWSAANEYGATDIGTSTAQTMATTTWHDVILTWTGDNSANGIEVWHDGVRVFQDTCARLLLSPYDANQQNLCANIAIGADDRNGTSYASYHIDEFVIWDEVIDPTAILLTSGSGSLNGASRTAYVDVAAYSKVDDYSEINDSLVSLDSKIDAIKANTDLIPAAL